MTDAYLILKTLHIVSAAILFGTGLGIAFFAWFGYRRSIKAGSIESLRTVLRLTVLGDAYFTAPAVLFQLISGLALLHMDRWPLFSPWALTSIGLFILVGFLWLPVVVIQILMSREANQAASTSLLSDSFHRRFIIWFVLGVPAFLIVIALFFLMVVKPLPFT